MQQYEEERIIFTRQELDRLRQYVLSPLCNPYDLILRLKNPKLFARAVLNNDMDICSIILPVDDVVIPTDESDSCDNCSFFSALDD